MSLEELEAVKICYGIHLDLIEFGRRETASRTDGTKVFCYLDHDMIGSGKLPFVRYDQRTKETSTSWPVEIAKRIKSHLSDMKVYFQYVRLTDQLAEKNRSRPPVEGSSRSVGPPTPSGRQSCNA